MDASTDVPVPIFSGECFQLWSTQMKQYLESQGLLYLIQGCYKKPAPAVPADEEILELREDLLNDATALMIIRKSLSPIIFTSIHSALTTKDAWDLLQHEFMTPSSSAEQNATKVGKKKKVVVNTEEGCSDVPPSNDEQAARTTVGKRRKVVRDTEDSARLEVPQMNDLPCGSNSRKSTTPMRRSVRIEKLQARNKINEPPYTTMDGRDVETTRSKSDKLCGKRKNVEPQEYQVKATLESTIGNYEVIFIGREELKVGSEGWRQFVADHKLVEGDRLAVKVIKHSHTQHEFMVSLPRCTSSRQMQEELNRRGSQGMDDDEDSTNVNDVDCNNYVHNVGDDGEDDDDINDVVENEFQNKVTRYYIIIISKDDIGGDVDMEDEDDIGDGEVRDGTGDVEEEDVEAKDDTGDVEEEDGKVEVETGDGEAKDDTGDGEAEAETGDGEAKDDTGDGEAKADTGNGEVKDDGDNEDDSEDSWEEDGDYVWWRG